MIQHHLDKLIDTLDHLEFYIFIYDLKYKPIHHKLPNLITVKGIS